MKRPALNISVITVIIFLLVLSTNTGLISQTKYMTKVPVDFGFKEKELFEKARESHDKHQFENAINLYREIIEINPFNPEVYYEIGYTFSEMNKCDSVIKYSKLGMNYKSDVFPLLAVNLGCCLEHNGCLDSAEHVLTQAVKAMPWSALLHYNLGLTYNKQLKSEEAKKCFIKSAFIDPNYAATQYSLLTYYFNNKNYISALLTGCRYLLLEPNKYKSVNALKMLNATLDKGILSDNIKSSNHKISENDATRLLAEANDWTPIEKMMKMDRATEKVKNANEFELKSHELKKLFRLLSLHAELHDKISDFTSKYYTEFFAELYKRDYADAAIHEILFKELDTKGLTWVKENANKINEMKKWMEEYIWPTEND